MALGKSNKSSAIYLSIFEGKVVRESLNPDVFEDPNGVQSRVNKNGKTVYYESFDYVEGHIVGAYTKVEKGMTDEFRLVIKDGDGQRYNLRFYFDSRFGKAFCQRMGAIDLDKPVTIRPYDFEDADGRRAAGVTVTQNGEKIPNQYSKDNPNGMPEPEKKKSRSGDITWDFSAQLDFLWERLLEFCAKVEAKYPRDMTMEEEERKPRTAPKAAPPAPEIADEEEEDEEETPAAPTRRTSSSRTVTSKRTAESHPDGAFESKPAKIPGKAPAPPAEEESFDDDLPF